MAQSLDRAFDARHNSLDFVRFVLTVSVVFFHSFAFSGFRQAPLRFPGGEGFAHLVVPSFFAIRGFLIARSFLTTGSTARYLWQRALRIFPAYWVCLLLTSGVVAPFA